MSKIRFLFVIFCIVLGNEAIGFFNDPGLPRGGKTIKDEFASEEKKIPPKPKSKKVVRRANSDIQIMNHLLRRNIELLEKLIAIMENYEKE